MQSHTTTVYLQQDHFGTCDKIENKYLNGADIYDPPRLLCRDDIVIVAL